MPHFAKKCNFLSPKILKSKSTFSSIFNFTNFFAFNWMKSFVIEKQKRKKTCQIVLVKFFNFSLKIWVLFCIADVENVVFRQNEEFLVKTKQRFGFSDQKYISWVGGSSPNIGSLEFGYFSWTVNIRLFHQQITVKGQWFR